MVALGIPSQSGARRRAWLDMDWDASGKHLRVLARRIRASRGIDHARLRAIRRQLDQGEYQIMPAAIADALISMEEALTAADSADNSSEE